MDEDEGRAVTVIACGERYRDNGTIRFAARLDAFAEVPELGEDGGLR